LIIASGGLLTATGYGLPFFIGGAALATVGTGLIYTLDVNSRSSHWIGYQVLAGIGLGLCFQMPVMNSQATAAPEDVSVVTAMLMCM
jgi:hypothetical protein